MKFFESVADWIRGPKIEVSRLYFIPGTNAIVNRRVKIRGWKREEEWLRKVDEEMTSKGWKPVWEEKR